MPRIQYVPVHRYRIQTSPPPYITRCTDPDRAEADTIRILVATDNHVGYEERDPIRKDDSWQTFDEIMTLARTQDVGAAATPRLNPGPC